MSYGPAPSIDDVPMYPHLKTHPYFARNAEQKERPQVVLLFKRPRVPMFLFLIVDKIAKRFRRSVRIKLRSLVMSPVSE